MNAELRRVRFHERMSDETNCFEAEVWVDGEKLADVCNRGQGGSNEYSPVGGLGNPKWKAFEAFCKDQPHEYDFEEMDQYVGDLFEGWLKKDNERRAQAQVKRWCKTQTVFRLKGDEEGRWHTVKALYSGKVKQYIVAKYGDKVECIANEGVTA